MNDFFTELWRRNVIRVAAAYVIVAWLLAQIADLALENFGAPDWVIKTILLLLVMGLPIAIVLAWAFELTPDGIQRDGDVDKDESTVRSSNRNLNLLIIGLLAIALLYFVYESRFQTNQSDQDVSTVVAGLSVKSIAVIPFANFGSNEADSFLADGLAETLLNLLAQIDELQVAARTSAFKFKDTKEDIRVIGEQLGVATVLEGSVQRSGNRVRITAQLINVEDGFHLYSETFERELDDIFAVQDEIAQAVVKALEVELLGSACAEC
jgi:TolB-like protein